MATVELVAPADEAPVLGAVAERALEGALSVVAPGVYFAEVLRALDPAEAEPEAAKEVAAPGPLVPAEALART